MSIRIETCRPYTDDPDLMTRGYVKAERINDIVAKPNTKRYQDYLAVVQNQFIDPETIDPDDQYRQKLLLEAALTAYETRHKTKLEKGRIYTWDDFSLCAAPEGVWDALSLGVTAHVRKSEKAYDEAAEAGITPAYERLAQAMMHVTNLSFWVILEYWENRGAGKRRLFEHVIERNKPHGRTLEGHMINFYARTRLRAAS